MHIPAFCAFLAIVAEFFGGLGLIFGFLARIAALGIFTNMVVAIAMVHHQFGFFMNWTGEQKGEGYEYHLPVLAITVFLMIRGAGAASLDRILSSAEKALPEECKLPENKHMKDTAGRITAPQLWWVMTSSHHAVRLLAEQSITNAGLCLKDFAALEALLHKGPLTITQIQEKVLLASGSMTAAIDRLEKRGLLVRKSTSSDRRVRIVELTQEVHD